MNRQTTQNAKRKLVGGLAAATLGALLLAPPSGWLVRAQLQSAVGQFPGLNESLPSSAGDDRAQRAARVAADPKFRSDMGLQMAAAQARASTKSLTTSGVPYSTGSQVADALMPLGGTWVKPDPVLMAAVLRYMSQEAVHVNDWSAIALLDNRKPDARTPKPAQNVNTKDHLINWELLCYWGEITDSNNAYFPLMDAVGYFAAGKNDKGIEALLLASEKPRYDEYLSEEIEGKWRLNRELQGESGTIATMSISAAQLLPHYSQIRAAGRVALAEAVRAETAGDTEKGYQIRRALTRIGALMRTDSTFMIGGFVGRAVSIQAWSRPGGALPFPPSKTEAERKERPAKERARYCAYLERIGHGEAVSEVVWEDKASETYRGLWQRADENPNNLLQLQPIQRLMTQWAVGVGLLTNLVVLLMLGGLCALIARWNARVRAGLPLSAAARAGAVSALALPTIGLGVALFWPEPVSLLLILGGAGALSGMVLGTVRRAKRADLTLETVGQNCRPVFVWRSPNVRAYLGGMATTWLCVAGLALVGQSGPMKMLGETNTFLGLACGAATGTESSNTFFGLGELDGSHLIGALFSAGASSCVSILLLFGLAIYSRIRRVPVTVGVVRGLRRVALPVAFALVFIYVGLTLNTLQKEARATADLQSCVRTGEPAYLANLLHEALPARYSTKTNAAQQKFIVIDSYNGPLSGIPGKGKVAK